MVTNNVESGIEMLNENNEIVACPFLAQSAWSWLTACDRSPPVKLQRAPSRTWLADEVESPLLTHCASFVSVSGNCPTSPVGSLLLRRRLTNWGE